MNAPIITITPPARYTSGDGRAFALSTADITGIVEAYDAIADPAPIVINTPKMDDQAWGWISDLSMRAGKIVAAVQDMPSAFAERVRKGAFSGVSASFYPPNHDHSPKPGKWYLKHISFKTPMVDLDMPAGAAAFAEIRHGETLNVSGRFVPQEGEIADFRCPSGFSLEAGQMALFARAKALQAINPSLTIIEAALRAEQSAPTSFGELGEAVLVEAAFVSPDVQPPAGCVLDPNSVPLYHQAKALMIDDRSLTIVAAALKARQQRST